MATREQVYKRFGPRLTEAILMVVFSEINAIRSELGLSERTMQQTIDAVQNEWQDIPKYEWAK